MTTILSSCKKNDIIYIFYVIFILFKD